MKEKARLIFFSVTSIIFTLTFIVFLLLCFVDEGELSNRIWSGVIFILPVIFSIVMVKRQLYIIKEKRIKEVNDEDFSNNKNIKSN